jgi:molybdopterin-binding protein
VKLSTRNQIRARVVGIAHGEAIANVEMDANGQRLVASITLEAVRELGIAEGNEVLVLLKASDVMIAVEE